MGFFSFSYEYGGEKHTKITDKSFTEAQEIVQNDKEVINNFKEIAKSKELHEYETFDFPVSKILAHFYIAYQIQEDSSGIPEELKFGNYEMGSKDMIQYRKFIDQYNSKIQKKADAWERKSFKERIASKAFSAVVSGVSGKSENVRILEKHILNYICGDSQKAKDYIMKYVIDLDADDMVFDVCQAIQGSFFRSEAVKYNRR